MSQGLGFSGRIARAFQSSPLTPVLAIAAILLGIAATLITPREEEPQIDVTMANVIVPFPGADVHDVENLVAYPLEQKLSGATRRSRIRPPWPKSPTRWKPNSSTSRVRGMSTRSVRPSAP